MRAVRLLHGDYAIGCSCLFDFLPQLFFLFLRFLRCHHYVPGALPTRCRVMRCRSFVLLLYFADCLFVPSFPAHRASMRAAAFLFLLPAAFTCDLRAWVSSCCLPTAVPHRMPVAPFSLRGRATRAIRTTVSLLLLMVYRSWCSMDLPADSTSTLVLPRPLHCTFPPPVFCTFARSRPFCLRVICRYDTCVDAVTIPRRSPDLYTPPCGGTFCVVAGTTPRCDLPSLPGRIPCIFQHCR